MYALNVGLAILPLIIAMSLDNCVACLSRPALKIAHSNLVLPLLPIRQRSPVQVRFQTIENSVHTWSKVGSNLPAQVAMSQLQYCLVPLSHQFPPYHTVLTFRESGSIHLPFMLENAWRIPDQNSACNVALSVLKVDGSTRPSFYPSLWQMPLRNFGRFCNCSPYGFKGMWYVPLENERRTLSLYK